MTTPSFWRKKYCPGLLKVANCVIHLPNIEISCVNIQSTVVYINPFCERRCSVQCEIFGPLMCCCNVYVMQWCPFSVGRLLRWLQSFLTVSCRFVPKVEQFRCFFASLPITTIVGVHKNIGSWSDSITYTREKLATTAVKNISTSIDFYIAWP